MFVYCYSIYGYVSPLLRSYLTSSLRLHLRKYFYENIFALSDWRRVNYRKLFQRSSEISVDQINTLVVLVVGPVLCNGVKCGFQGLSLSVAGVVCCL